MKKIISIILAVSFLLSMSACSSDKQEKSNNTSEIVTDSNTNATETTQNISGKKVLIIYFSSANTNSPDVISSATPKAGGMASTEYIANYIQKKTGGDIEKLTPVKDYPESYNDTIDVAKAEKNNNERPEFKELSVNPADYDVIFVGYPMWWYTLPMIFYTFFDKYDLSGKTIIPFNTHAGSGDGGTYEEIKEFEPNATVLDGIAISGNSADKANGDLDEWLKGLGY